MAFPVGALINGDGGVQVTVADKSFISKLFNFFSPSSSNIPWTSMSAHGSIVLNFECHALYFPTVNPSQAV